MVYLKTRTFAKAVILFEILVLVGIGFYFLRTPADVVIESPLPKASVTAVDTDASNKKLQHYYTLTPGHDLVTDDSWLPSTATHTVTTQGFNERRLYATTTPEDVTRILMLGHSYVFGMYVNTDANYSEQLEDIIHERCRTNVEVINAGMPGYDVEYTNAWYEEHASQFGADTIVWLMDQGLETINEVTFPLNEQCLRRVSQDEYNKVQSGGDVSHPCSDEAVAVLYNQMTRDEILSYQGTILERTLADDTIKWVLMQVRDTAYVGRYLEGLAREHDHVYSVTLADDTDSKPYRLPDYHPNPKGHRYIAEQLFEYLTREQLLSCSDSGHS